MVVAGGTVAIAQEPSDLGTDVIRVEAAVPWSNGASFPWKCLYKDPSMSPVRIRRYTGDLESRHSTEASETWPGTLVASACPTTRVPGNLFHGRQEKAMALTYLEMSLETRLQTRRKEGETLGALREMVDLHFSLFKHPGLIEPNEANKVHRVWLGLTTSASHSSRVSLHALESGYYTQSFALTRAVFEDWLTAYDCKEHTETVEALLDSNRTMPRFSTMYKRLPCELKRLWGAQGDFEGTYGFLSTFAHPRGRAIEDTMNIEGRVRVVPEYDEIRFALAAFFLTKAILLMMEFVERLADYLDSPGSHDWKNFPLKIVKPKGFVLLESLDQRLLSYLEQPENYSKAKMGCTFK